MRATVAATAAGCLSLVSATILEEFRLRTPRSLDWLEAIFRTNLQILVHELMRTPARNRISGCCLVCSRINQKPIKWLVYQPIFKGKNQGANLADNLEIHNVGYSISDWLPAAL